MNHPFIKMLRFEIKANSKIWLFILIASFALLFFVYYGNSISSNSESTIVLNSSIFVLLICLFTIYSYQESTKVQSMQLYHLIPISKNIKFLTKLFITIIGLPAILLLVSGMFEFFFRLNSQLSVNLWSNSQKMLSWIVTCILGHSICTFSAIAHKKNKVINTILTFIAFKLVIGIIMLMAHVLLHLKDITTKSLSLTYFPAGEWSVTIMLILSVAIYVISYFSFIGREL